MLTTTLKQIRSCKDGEIAAKKICKAYGLDESYEDPITYKDVQDACSLIFAIRALRLNENIEEKEKSGFYGKLREITGSFYCGLIDVEYLYTRLEDAFLEFIS